ncbi:hypothetical protein ACQZ6S_05750 [Agrobacterium tumefaciens]
MTIEVGEVAVLEMGHGGIYVRFGRNEICWNKSLGLTISYYSLKTRTYKSGVFRMGLVRD